jgi:hypothetical protein
MDINYHAPIVFLFFRNHPSHLNPLLTIREQLNEGSLKDAGDAEILRYLWQTSGDESVQKLIDLYPKPYRPSGVWGKTENTSCNGI